MGPGRAAELAAIHREHRGHRAGGVLPVDVPPAAGVGDEVELVVRLGPGLAFGRVVASETVSD